jgi:hypothetical protein
MNRRQLLKTGAVGAATTTIASPAIAQAIPELRAVSVEAESGFPKRAEGRSLGA